MVMLMVIVGSASYVVIGLMLMVMVGCSNGSMIPTNTPIPMVHTETPAPTSTPIPLSHNQGQEQVIDALITFNKMSNDFAEFISVMDFFQNNRMIAPEAAVSIAIPVLDIYADAIQSWQTTEFKDSNWVQVNQTLNNMRELELEKIAQFKVLSQQAQNAYIQKDLDQLRAVIERMWEFGQSKIAKQTSQLQYQLLKELSISPNTVNFNYANMFKDELDEIEKPALIDKM